MKSVFCLAMALVCSTVFAVEPGQRALTFDERVAAQTAIERVYYGHQLGTSKPFEDAVPKSVVEAKIHKYLEQSAALIHYWKTAVTDQSLQRELERMAQGTRMPERLQELYTALGNDSFLVKECLARPTLVDRLTRGFYTFDPVIHAKARAQAAALRAQLLAGGLSPAADHPSRTVIEISMGSGATPGPTKKPKVATQTVTADQFSKLRADYPDRVGQVSDVQESREAFIVNVVLSESATAFRVAHYVTPKSTWDAWWDTVHGSLGGASVTAIASASSHLPAPRSTHPMDPSAVCADDSWSNGSLGDVPDARMEHAAVWTGTEMIVWGGYAEVAFAYTNTGARYDPVTDTWRPTSLAGAPVGRMGPSVVWAGSRMIVWGGSFLSGSPQYNTGGRYDPVSDSWAPVTRIGAPSPRSLHSAVWTGSRMVIWGGVHLQDGNPRSVLLKDGGQYDPETDHWTPTSIVGAPSGREGHIAVWTGQLMVIWGGTGGSITGGRYDPALDRWTSMQYWYNATASSGYSAVWTGHEMIVWGGQGYYNCNGGTCFDDVNTGGRYNPDSDSWIPTSTQGAPYKRSGHNAVWTGSRMLIWGGGAPGGGQYDPITDSWTPASSLGAPSPRDLSTAVWTGSLMVVWGGGNSASHRNLQNTGGRYDPATDSWTPTSTAGAPAARHAHTAAWTGSLMIVWGGVGVDAAGIGVALDTGGRYDPATDHWSATSMTDAPAARAGHTAVWTGGLMLIWGAGDAGGRYDPDTDSWTPLSGDGSPSLRASHSAVWTGSRMLVWGGYALDDSGSLLSTGGRYDPLTDSWASTSEIGAPSARNEHTALWTGSLMVVWGGYGASGAVNTGGRYDPATDTWASTSMSGVPAARYSHTAVWTGSRMIVWGGQEGYGNPGTGGRYDPASDSWSPTSATFAPDARTGHAAVWTGRLMVIWGGSHTGFNYSDVSGRRYDPLTDSWSSLSNVNEPTRRASPSAVWTGTGMIVWGGTSSGSGGGQYVPGNVMADDCDGDGFTEAAGDCNDHNASVYPGAPQVCDGINNDCADPSWPYLPPNTEIDYDQDGFLNCNGDCDDLHATVYPGAPQLCDGLNNDCSDPSWPAVPANEADADGDGARVCDGDCDDADPNRRPGFYEECDGIDNDCNGVVDDGGATASCNDSNPCTDDTCGGAAGCLHSFNTSPCDDGWPCSGNDVCAQGECHGTPLTGTPCNDYDPCTTEDTCMNGDCIGGAPLDCNDGDVCNGAEFCLPYYGCRASYPLYCDDNNPCTDDSCDPVAGCVHANNARACNDGNACTIADTCSGGSCSGVPITCNDNNVCTDDSCNPSIGCVFVSNVPLHCDDGNPCTTDLCSAVGGCYHINNTLDCDDGNRCTLGDTCRDGICRAGTLSPCNDGNACTADSCDPAVGCIFTNITGACDDGSVCTTNDLCGPHNPWFGENFDAVSPPNLPDGWRATFVSGIGSSWITRSGNGEGTTNSASGLDVARTADDVLDSPPIAIASPEAVLTFKNRWTFENTTNCYDGAVLEISIGGSRFMDIRAAGGRFETGPYTGTVTEDSDNPLTGREAWCYTSPGYPDYITTTVHLPAAAAGKLITLRWRIGCDGAVGAIGQDIDSVVVTDPTYVCAGTPLDCGDGDACTTDWCDADTGCMHEAADCNDGSACTLDSCDSATGCVHTPVDCDDHNACTTDVCDYFSGCSHSAITCFDNNPCTDDTCNPASGCAFTNNTKACDDGNRCTSGDVCGGGQCHSGAAVVCNDNNPCTTGTCSPSTGCVFANNANACDDGNACTTGDVCAGGVCRAGAPAVCNDNNPCTDDSCDPATGCMFAPKTGSCDDGNACTTGDTCLDGVCRGSAIACNDGNPCTTDDCNPATGCVYINNTNPCDDGNACTTHDACGPLIWLGEDFDGSRGPRLPTGWTSQVVGTGLPWVPRFGGADSSLNSVFAANSDHVADATLETPAIAIGPSAATLTFRNRWRLEGGGGSCYDAGVLEIKIGTGAYTDIVASGGSFVTGGYTGVVELAYGNPLGGRAAWCSDSLGYPVYVTTTVNLPAAASGQTVRFRWRLGSDSSTAAVGQDIDSVVVAASTNTCRGLPAYCDDGNPCTMDSCDPSTGCVHAVTPGAACDDGNACTVNDACTAAGACLGFQLDCSDDNPCTDDTCNPATGCAHTNNTTACSDDNPCTTGDICGGGTCHAGAPVICAPSDSCHQAGTCNPATGTCSSPIAPNGTACNDGNLCTTGDICTSGVCGGISHLNEPHPKTIGYYKELCSHAHDGDQLTTADAVCVAESTATFDTQTVADLCLLLGKHDGANDDHDDHPAASPSGCDKARAELVALALNRCRARVCDAQQIDSDCAGSTAQTVGQSFQVVDGVLSGTSPTSAVCKNGQCLAKEINSGHAFEIDDVHCDRDDHHRPGGMRCHWSVPRYNDGTTAPGGYDVLRRRHGSGAFTRVASVATPEYYVEDPGENYEYDFVPIQ